jgi:hypothetical protein
MAGNYATKSIVLIDFMDVRDIAIAIPFYRRGKWQLTLASPVTYWTLRKLSSLADVHLIAV